MYWRKLISCVLCVITLMITLSISPSVFAAGKKASVDTERLKYVRTCKQYYARTKEQTDEEIKKIKARTLTEGFEQHEQDALNLLNVYRYLCGLSPTVELDDSHNEKAKAAAKRCSDTGKLAHDLGSHTDKCNLHCVGSNVAQVNGYIDDPGGPNRKERGHRAHILSPSLGKTGFGVYKSYTAMYVLDYSGNGRGSKTAASYPGRGFFPREYLRSNGWSYFPKKAPRKQTDITVEMFRLHEPPKKQFPRKGDIKVKADPIKINAVFYSTRRDPQIIFEPEFSSKPQAGDIYFVRISAPGISDGYIVELY